MTIDQVMSAISAEVVAATQKWPTWPTDPLHAVTVLNEEVGELNKAALQYVYEPSKTNLYEIQKEATQTAAMAVRFLMSLTAYEFKPSAQHDQ